MNWYKKAYVDGEWWITDTGDVLFADGDVGEYNHEMYVIEQILNSELGVELGEFDFSKTEEEELIQLGINQDAINVLRGKTDAREYGMKNLGWTRVADRYIQAWYLTGTVLKNIANGLYEAFGADAFKSTYVVESLSNGKNYSPVTYEAIDSGNPRNLLQYREWDVMNLRAKNKNWYKKAQFEDPPEWDFPEADHDYNPNWDYEVDPIPDQKLMQLSENIMNEINSDIIPQIGMGKAKASYVKNFKETDTLAKYVFGTAPHPVFVINLETIRSAAEEYKVDISVGIETTITHELGHAIQDWMGLSLDENQAEEFARTWHDFREIDNFWE